MLQVYGTGRAREHTHSLHIIYDPIVDFNNHWMHRPCHGLAPETEKRFKRTMSQHQQSARKPSLRLIHLSTSDSHTRTHTHTHTHTCIDKHTSTQRHKYTQKVEAFRGKGLWCLENTQIIKAEQPWLESRGFLKVEIAAVTNGRDCLIMSKLSAKQCLDTTDTVRYQLVLRDYTIDQ